MKKLMWILLMAFVLAACGSQEPIEIEPVEAGATAAPTEELCSVQSAGFIAELEGIFEAWDDAVALASNTPRGSLAEQVAKLQELKRVANALDAPTCAMFTKKAFVNYADLVIDSFMDFMADRNNLKDYELVASSSLIGLSLDWSIESLVNLKLDIHQGEIRVDYFVHSNKSSSNVIVYTDADGNEVEVGPGYEAKVPWAKTIWVERGTNLSLNVESDTRSNICAILINGEVVEVHNDTDFREKYCNANAEVR